MTILYSTEEIVQYLYNETSTDKKAAIESALQQDWTLREKVEVLKTSIACLEKGLESPRMEPILYALNYAKETFAESVPDL